MNITITKKAAKVLGVQDLVTTQKEIEFLKESNAIEGVYNQDSLIQAIKAWQYLKLQKEMKVDYILEAHRILMQNENILTKEKGHFRKIQVWIGGREGIAWQMIEEAMIVVCLNAWLWPQHWKRHHIRFEAIHPFVDGNGRMGRLLLNWERRKRKLPIKIIKASERKAYYEWFE